MEKYKYKFSIIIPIYNVEKYLDEAIQSVINQTIGFEENIQLILINDGSKDRSEEICLKYQKKYPNNIIYEKQKNAGVSQARNTGMKYIEGKYVNFLDGDDKWEKDAFIKIWDFFEKNNKKIDLVSCRMQFFDSLDSYHNLDYKFQKNQIINIFEDYKYIHLHITSSVIKSEVAKGIKFDTRLKYGEDTKYVNEIILDKHKYGVVQDAKHYYRKRMDETSAIQNKEKSVEWYTTTIEYDYKYLMDLSISKYKKVIPYIQYIIMYDIQFRIKNKIPKNIDKNIKVQYKNEIINILQYMDDNIICEQKGVFGEHKVFMLSLKYGRDVSKDLIYKDGKLYFNNIPIYKIKRNKKILKIDCLNIVKNKLIIEGRVNTIINKSLYKIFVKTNKKEKIQLTLEEGKKSIFTRGAYAFDGTQIISYYTYKIEIPLKKIKSLCFLFNFKAEVEKKLDITFQSFAKLSDIENHYFAKGKYILKYKDKKINIYTNSKKNRIHFIYKYFLSLMKLKEFKVILYRALYLIYNRFNKKQIWLVSDRENRADDNGEHFFKYLQKIDNNKIKSYFVIDNKCPDYKRLKKIGKVVSPNSLKFKILFLASKNVLSSQANVNVINPFYEKEKYVKDLYTFNFVFLQHGITKNNLSKWLEKYNKNIRLFVTAAKKEYESILNGNYYYTEKEVKLTGFPRYDTLVDNKKRSIVILPTQRRKLVEWKKGTDSEKIYNPFFKESEFFKFYNNLINDERIIEALKKYNYKLKFGLHPLLLKQVKDFDKNDFVEIMDYQFNYQNEFSENALLITDYSSVSFDFAYLRKPIIYTQFDKKSFYEGQIYDKGYFDDEKDGFGPVCLNYESAVKEIIKYIENDCALEEKYLERINNFYTFNDQNNCKRVYEEILKL